MDNYENDNLEPKTSFDENQETTNNNNLNDEKIQSGQLYFSLDEKKTNIIYDISNFSMIFLFICCIGYCMFVPFANYNWTILVSTLCCALIFFVLAHTTQIMVTETKFSRVSNYLLENINYENTFDIVKICTKWTLTGLKYLLGLYPIMALLCATVVPYEWTSNYFPYPFHSNCSGMGIFIIAVVSATILICILKFKIKYVGEILGAILLYMFFDEQLFDAVANICETIGYILVIGIFLYIVYWILRILFIILLPFLKALDAMYKAEQERKAKIMIGSVKQENNSVRVYDTEGRFLFSLNGKLQGFTSETVSVKFGYSVNVYDKNGNFKYSN